jgi:hypothetical protein
LLFFQWNEKMILKKQRIYCFLLFCLVFFLDYFQKEWGGGGGEKKNGEKGQRTGSNEKGIIDKEKGGVLQEGG